MKRIVTAALCALMLSGCAVQTVQQARAAQLAHAEYACSTEVFYLYCVDSFAVHNYGMQVKQRDDGTLALVEPTGPRFTPGGVHGGLLTYGSPNSPQP